MGQAVTVVNDDQSLTSAGDESDGGVGAVQTQIEGLFEGEVIRAALLEQRRRGRRSSVRVQLCSDVGDLSGR